MKALRRLLLVVAAVLPLASLAEEAAKPPPPPPISFYGILHYAGFHNGGTFAAQDAAYQGSLTASTGGSYYSSARQTRFGAKLNLGDENLFGAAITGQLEFDFMGSNTATNSSGSYNPNVRLRHANMTAAWMTGAGKFALTAGQDWDMVLNLNPDSIAYLANPMFGQSGNMFRRAPQVRLDWTLPLGALAVGAQVGVMNPVDTNNASVDNGVGNQSRTPNYMGRAFVNLKGDFGGTIGVGYETEKRRFGAGTATQKDVTTSLLGIDADIGLSRFFQVKGEFFMDKGQADALAGLVANTTQRTVTAAGDVVESSGIWAQAIVKPVPELFITAGIAVAQIDKATLDTANGAAAIANGDRTQNESASVGLIVNVSKAWKLGVDYYMTTSTYGDAVKTKVDIQQIALSSQLRF